VYALSWILVRKKEAEDIQNDESARTEK